MTRRNIFLLLTIGIAILGLCAGLVGYRLIVRRSAPAPAVVSPPSEAPEAGAPPASGPISTIIDLPGDPVLVHRGATVAPKSLRVALPISLAANAPKVESAAFFVNAHLVPSDGGFMGKFLEAAPGADVADPALALAGTPLVVDASDAANAGFDDDGGASTPDSPQQSMVTDLNSSQFEVSIGGSNAKPQIKEAVIRVVVQEKISDLLIRNGFAEDGARAIEAAAKTLYNIQSLPPSSIAIAQGSLDTSGSYRIAQLAIFENKEYVGAVALAESGGYGEGAQPTLPEGLLDEGPKDVDMAVHYNLSDGVYSAGVRNNVPEPVIREAIQLLGKLTDLNIPLPPEENIRVFYARDFRGKSKLSGKVIYVGLSGPGGAVDCYSFQSSDGAFRCFDPKGGGVPTPPINSGAPTPPVNSGGAPVNGGRIFAPIRGAPVTSLFGMRFHPILHILRLHAGIDFGAPVGSQVRAVADGKVEIAGPVSGFGNHVRVQHRGFETSYSHLSEISVAVGANVTQGQIIALSGNTGLSTGPHLHFEYYLDRVAVDPMPHMGTEVAGAGGAVAAVAIGAAPPSEQEIAAFAASKTMVDAALQAASE
jgi:murein DD-endopeptidase MepM/ murein hydrolase activator NlpD